MASMCRSAAAAVRSSALRYQSLLPKASPSRLASSIISRPIASAMGTVESLKPLHSAVASARLVSNIAVDSSCWSWPSQAEIKPWLLASIRKSKGEEEMDDLRRRRSIWLDGRQSRSKRTAKEEPQRWSFTFNSCRSFFHRLFSCASDGLAWQLRPISPDFVPQPRYKLLSRSEMEMKTVRNDDEIEEDGNKAAKLQSVTNKVKEYKWLPVPQRRWPIQGW